MSLRFVCLSVSSFDHVYLNLEDFFPELSEFAYLETLVYNFTCWEEVLLVR